MLVVLGSYFIHVGLGMNNLVGKYVELVMGKKSIFLFFV